MHIEITEWGEIHYYHFSCARFALYMYDDDRSTVYLSNLRVTPRKRGMGIGSAMLAFALEEAARLGAECVCLKCDRRSWVHGWYARHGFRCLCDDEEDDGCIWMKKAL